MAVRTLQPGTVILLAALVFAVGPVWAAPSALIQIPTAEVVEPNHACLDAAAALPTEGGSDVSDWVFESDFGVADGVELGFDTPLDSTADGAFFVKKIARIEDDLVAAVGVNSIGFEGQPPNHYLVMAATSLATLRLHGGADYVDSELRGILGVDYAASERVTWMADWFRGPKGSWSVGASIGFGPEHKWALMTGLIGDNSTGDTSVYINIGCTFALGAR